MRENGSIFSIRKYPSPNEHVRLDEITYWSDGLRVKGLLARPKALGDYDALLYLRGGLQSIGMVRPARIAQFAMQGFIVFAPYYRGNRGGEGRDEFAGVDRMDAYYAVDILKHFTSKPKVHTYGFSRGGIMALWIAILRQDIASVCVWAGVSDPKLVYEERVDMRRGLKRIIGGTPNKVPERYEWRSPLLQIEDLQAPILIIHGKKDRHVNIEHAHLLEVHLQHNNKKYEAWYEENEAHHYTPQLNRRVVKDLCRWMKERA